MKKLMIVLGLGSGIVFGAAFQNGGFESPVIMSSPNFGTVPTGWTKVDLTGQGLFMEFYSTFGLPTLGGQGIQAYGFGGNGATSGSLSQTFDTLTAANYMVTFQYVVQQGTAFEDLMVDALNGSTVIASSNPVRFNNTAWVTAILNFTAASSSTTLRFSDITGASGDTTGGQSTNWALDVVTVTQTSSVSPVPEPSTLAFVGLGSLAAFAFRRRIVRSS